MTRDEVFSMTVRQASERTGLSKENIKALINAKKILGYKPGRDWLVDWASLKNYIESN